MYCVVVSHVARELVKNQDEHTSGNHSQQKRATKMIQKTLSLFFVSDLSRWRVSRTVVMGKLAGYNIFVGQRSADRIIPAIPYPIS